MLLRFSSCPVTALSLSCGQTPCWTPCWLPSEVIDLGYLVIQCKDPLPCDASAGQHSPSGMNFPGNGQCRLCTAAAGSYCPVVSTLPSGTMCPADSYCPGGASLIQACQENSNSPTSSNEESDCLCKAGWTRALTGPNSGTCTKCVSGTFKIAPGNGPCTQCETGKTSAAGSDFSTCYSQCPPGTYGPNGECDACLEGTYKSLISAVPCSVCPDNTLSRRQSNALIECKCDAGYSGPDGGPCTACIPGDYKKMPGAAECSACDAGKYSSIVAANFCASCAADENSVPGSTQCTKIPVKTVEPVVAAKDNNDEAVDVGMIWIRCLHTNAPHISVIFVYSVIISQLTLILYDFHVYQHQILHVPAKGIAADVLAGSIVGGLTCIVGCLLAAFKKYVRVPCLVPIGGCLLAVFKKYVRVPCLVPNNPEYSIDTEKGFEVKGENPKTPFNYENSITLDASYSGQQANARALKGYHLHFLPCAWHFFFPLLDTCTPSTFHSQCRSRTCKGKRRTGAALKCGIWPGASWSDEIPSLSRSSHARAHGSKRDADRSWLFARFRFFFLVYYRPKLNSKSRLWRPTCGSSAYTPVLESP